MNKNPPVCNGQEIELYIGNLGEKGDGIANHEGFIIFVPGTEAQKTYKVRIKRVLKTYAFAEVI